MAVKTWEEWPDGWFPVGYDAIRYSFVCRKNGFPGDEYRYCEATVK